MVKGSAAGRTGMRLSTHATHTLSQTWSVNLRFQRALHAYLVTLIVCRCHAGAYVAVGKEGMLDAIMAPAGELKLGVSWPSQRAHCVPYCLSKQPATCSASLALRQLHFVPHFAAFKISVDST